MKLGISITSGFMVDFGDLTEKQLEEIKQDIDDNGFDFEKYSKMLGLDIEMRCCVHSETIVDEHD